jgi:hypothetical protein
LSPDKMLESGAVSLKMNVALLSVVLLETVPD